MSSCDGHHHGPPPQPDYSVIYTESWEQRQYCAVCVRYLGRVLPRDCLEVVEL